MHFNKKEFILELFLKFMRVKVPKQKHMFAPPSDSSIMNNLVTFDALTIEKRIDYINWLVLAIIHYRQIFGPNNFDFKWIKVIAKNRLE